MCVVTFDHEALGHGGMCLALGGHIRVLTSSVFRCDLQSVWIDPAGPFGNLLVGALAGLILYLFTMRWAARALLDLWPRAAAARGVARSAWAAASIGAALAALAYAGEGFGDLRDAILEIGASSWPLLVIPRSNPSTAEALPEEFILRNWTVVCTSAFAYAIFVATLGRGLRF
jgi:hypothetical protein